MVLGAALPEASTHTLSTIKTDIHIQKLNEYKFFYY